MPESRGFLVWASHCEVFPKTVLYFFYIHSIFWQNTLTAAIKQADALAFISNASNLPQIRALLVHSFWLNIQGQPKVGCIASQTIVYCMLLGFFVWSGELSASCQIKNAYFGKYVSALISSSISGWVLGGGQKRSYCGAQVSDRSALYNFAPVFKRVTFTCVVSDSQLCVCTIGIWKYGKLQSNMCVNFEKDRPTIPKRCEKSLLPDKTVSGTLLTMSTENFVDILSWVWLSNNVKMEPPCSWQWSIDLFSTNFANRDSVILVWG